MAATSHNNRKEDAQLLYIMEFASSRLPQAMELRPFICGKRDDFFAVDVRRHALAQALEHQEVELLYVS